MQSPASIPVDSIRQILAGTLTLLTARLWAGDPTARVSPSVDVRSYGAKGDGVTDDAFSMQAAIDACPQGGTVMLPKGKWMVRLKTVRLRSGVSLTGVGPDSILIKGRDLSTAITASGASHLTIEKLKLAVEATARPTMESRLALFIHCTDLILRDCVLDGTIANGLPSQFSLCQFVCCNDVKCLDNRFFNAAGSATGVTGASGEPTWGIGSEFARNVIDGFCDTGIGIWTGARNSHVHDNILRGGSAKYASFPVGIDVDGGTHSLIENNDIAGGQIAIRLYDTHDGVYPIEGLVVRGNFLHDQRTYNDTHPAWAIKPENPKSIIEATFVKNRIFEPAPNALGFMGGGSGRTVLHIDQNKFTGGAFWVFGAYKQGSLEVFSDGRKVDWRSTHGNNTATAVVK